MSHRHSVSADDSATDLPFESLDHIRLGFLIASGDLPFPSGLARDDAIRLAVEVRGHRRTQLVQFLARQVAQHLHHRLPDKS